MIAWRIHTNALVEAGYGVGDAAWVFSKGAKHEELVRNLRDLLERSDDRPLQPGFDPSRFREFDPGEFENSTAGRSIWRLTARKCPDCGAAVPRTRLTCDECKAYRIRDRVFPKEQSYVFPDPIEPRQSEGQS